MVRAARAIRMSANAEARSQGLSQKAKRQRATAIIMADTMMHKNLIFLSIIACFRKKLCNFAVVIRKERKRHIGKNEALCSTCSWKCRKLPNDMQGQCNGSRV